MLYHQYEYFHIKVTGKTWHIRFLSKNSPSHTLKKFLMQSENHNPEKNRKKSLKDSVIYPHIRTLYID